MTTDANPFLDRERTRGELYGSSGRLVQRTGALHSAKSRGQPVAEVITELVIGVGGDTVLDVGCGRGSTTAQLAQRWAPRCLIGFDQSAALLAQARCRLPADARARFLRADFHALPVCEASVDIVVAAFCLYHAPQPDQVVAEFARCLRPGGLAILVTKSADSYRELDELVAVAGLDRHATTRPSLYQTFHSTNAEHVTARHLMVRRVVHHKHEFHFADAEHVARYITTTPKYALAEGDPHAVADRLRPVLGETGVSTSSTVSYLVAAHP
ncbi:class I SAM-dependent methyltransferase [Haloactinomyces albus]|uniref:Ubiquinone/menaquinone biosynthesis C-methylase UbiE n=1 Tax=Haloactinomyces albus TaxID=1352928 RepID=A0AAE3ZF91_9ACTN|nr:class I SAM-dependent methyltransferase [Haloactinomyces albus]MDR7303876.1 ubiquinone/menaquinone biosynthesis C-methylase UbiE [Haloactinomyces albus]